MDEDILTGKTLLVVDDETDLRDIVASELEFMGAKVFQAENISNAQKILKDNKVDLIISDIRMPGGTGIDLLQIVKGRDVDVPPVILITGFADITVEDAFDKGAEALINKPFKLDDLIRMVVRYTAPFDTRFSETCETQKSIHAVVDKNAVHFGRGGMSLPVETNGKKIDIGEAVDFDFDYENQHFMGTGICRWFKPAEHGSNKALVGVEIMNLNDQSLDHFRKMALDRTIIPYIPSIKA